MLYPDLFNLRLFLLELLYLDPCTLTLLSLDLLYLDVRSPVSFTLICVPTTRVRLICFQCFVLSLDLSSLVVLYFDPLALYRLTIELTALP